MFPFKSIFWLAIISSRCLIEARYFTFDVTPFSMVFSGPGFKTGSTHICNANDPPVCGETYRNVKNGKRDRQTFENQCEFDTYNYRFGNPFYKLKDGRCDSDDCPKCTNEERPVCYSVGISLNENRGFLNPCYYERYLCLHGRENLFIKMRDGRCEICKEIHSRFMQDPNYTGPGQDMQSLARSYDCVVDTTTPLIAE